MPPKLPRQPWQPHMPPQEQGGTGLPTRRLGSTYQSLDFPQSSGPKWNTPVLTMYCLKTMSPSALLFLR